MSTTPGPILSVSAGADDLRGLVNAIKNQMGEARTLIAQNNADIASDRRASLDAQTADERQAYREQIAALAEKNAAVRASIAELQQQAQKLAQQIPKIPLKVEVEGIDKEALSTIREELGVLLGPLNGVTGRISSLISLFKTLGKESKEGLQEAAQGAEKSAASSALAAAGIANLAGKFSSLKQESATVEKDLEGGGKQLNLFATAAGPAAQQLSLFANELKATTAAETGVAEGAAEGAVGTAVLSGGLRALLAPATLVATAFAVVIGSLFEAGKYTAELGEKYELLGQRIGLSANEVRSFAFVAASSGVPLETIVEGLTRLSVAIGGGRGGRGGGGGLDAETNRTRQSLELLIGSVQKAPGQFISISEALSRIADQFQLMPPGIAKTSLAVQLFGREGDRLIPTLNKGSSGIDELRAQAEKFGIDLTGQSDKAEAYNKAIKSLGDAWDKFKGTLAQLGVFDLVVAALDKLASGINLVANAFGAGAAGRAEGFAKAMTDGLSKGSVQGLEKFKEQSQKAIQDQARFVDAQTSGDVFGIQGSKGLDKSLLPPGASEEIQAQLVAIANKANQITSEDSRRAFISQQLATLREKEIQSGLLVLKQEQEITELENKRADAQARATLASPQNVAALQTYTKEVDKLNQEIAKSNQEFGILGGPGTQLKGQTQDIEAMRKELRGLLGEINSAQKAAKTAIVPPGGGAPAVKPIQDIANALPALQQKMELAKTKAANLASAERQAAEEAKRLADEHVRLGEELQKSGQAAIDAANHQLTSAEQVRVYTQELNTAITTQRSYLESLGEQVKGTEAGKQAFLDLIEAQRQEAAALSAVQAEDARYTAAKAANAAKQTALSQELSRGNTSSTVAAADQERLKQLGDQQKTADDAHKLSLNALTQSLRGAEAAYQNLIQALVKLVPDTQENIAVIKLLNDAIKQTSESEKKLSEASAKSAEDIAKEAEAHAKLAVESASLNKELAKLDEEYATAGEKEKTLRDRVTDSIDALQKENVAVAAIRAQLQNAQPDTTAYVELQKQLVDAERQRLEAEKKLVEEADELKKTSVDLKKAWSELTSVVEGFGVALPKSLVKIVAMVDGMQRLLKLIQEINATRGLNIPVQGGGGGAGGSSGASSSGGFFGRIKQVLGLGGTQLGGGGGGSAPSTTGLGQVISAIGPDQAPVGGGAATGVDSGGDSIDAASSGLSSAGDTSGTISAIGSDAAGAGGAAAGGLSGASGVLATAGPIAAGVGAAVGIIIGIVSALHAAAVRQAERIAAAIGRLTDSTTQAVSTADLTIAQGLATLQNQYQQAVAQLGGGQGSAKQDALAQLLPGIDQQIAQLRGQAIQIQQAFGAAFETSELPQSIQDIGSQIQSLNKQVLDYVNAGGSASIATQFLVNQLNSLKVSIGNDILQSEQQAIGLLQQEISLQVQKGQIIQQEAEAEANIFNQGVVSRERSTAQQQADQVLLLRQQRDTQLLQINQQLAATQAQLGDQQQIFGLTLNTNSLLQTQLAIQQQITAQTDSQITNLQKIQQYLPTTPTAVSPTGAPQIPVPTSTLTPGQTAAALPGTVPISSAAFLKVLLGTGAFGISVLTHLFGSVPQTLTGDQMESIITALQTGNAQGRNLVPQLQAALQAAQASQAQFNPSLGSSLQGIPTAVGGGSVNLGSGISLSGAPATATSPTSTSGAPGTANPQVNIAAADSVIIGTGSGATNLGVAATATQTAAVQLSAAATTLSGSGNDIVKAIYSGAPSTTTVSGAPTPGTTSSTSPVSPTSSLTGATVPLINQGVLAGLEPNVPSAQAGLPPPVLGINEVTDATQLAAAQFTAPFLPIVQALQGIIDIGNNPASRETGGGIIPIADPILRSAYSGAPASTTVPAPSSVTVNINGTANMSKGDLQKAVTDGLLNAYSNLRARRGTTVGNGA